MGFFHSFFRGWDDENECWRYGHYTRLIDGIRKIHCIIADNDEGLVRWYIHDPTSIDEATGFRDKNDKMVFGGDVVLKQITNDYEEERMVHWEQSMWKLFGGDNDGTPLGWNSPQCITVKDTLYERNLRALPSRKVNHD